MSRTKPIMARRVEAISVCNDMGYPWLREYGIKDSCKVAVLVISDPDALVEQAAKEVAKQIYCNADWDSLSVAARDCWRANARAALESLNLIAKRRAKK